MESAAAAAASAAAAAAARSSLTALSHQLMEQFSAANGATRSGNLVFSPLSIYSALSQIATSARGSTLRELLDVVGVRCSEELAQNAGYMVRRAVSGGGPPMVTYGSALWHDTTLTPKQAYREAAYSLSGVTGAVDFLCKPEKARNHINCAMSSSILPPKSVDQHTRLVHTSAVGLRGSWEMPFYRWRNKEHKFYRLAHGGDAVDAKFMHSNEDQLVTTYDGFKVLKMPYSANNDPLHGVPPWERAALMRNMTLPPPPATRYSMCIFLPDAPDGLWSLQDKMASSGPGFLHEHLPEKRVQVGEFRVPKFNLSFATSVKRVLQDLGVQSVFSARADLRGMLDDNGSPRQPLFLADLLHEADIEVDEDGTQPAAYTACAMCGACLWPERRPGCVDFVADHPFVFFVMEEVSGVVLLAGHVLDPTQGHPSTSSL